MASFGLKEHGLPGGAVARRLPTLINTILVNTIQDMKKLLLVALATVAIGCGKSDEAAETTTTTTTTTTEVPSSNQPTVDPYSTTPGTTPSTTTMPGTTPPAGGVTVPPTTTTMPPPGMPAPNNQKSSLIVTNSTMMLTPAKLEESSTIELSCGCPFELRVENFSGATNAIKYEQFDAKTAQTHKVGLRFKAQPNAPKGTHTAKLAFLNTGSKGDYRDTIVVTYKL